MSEQDSLPREVTSAYRSIMRKDLADNENIVGAAQEKIFLGARRERVAFGPKFTGDEPLNKVIEVDAQLGDVTGVVEKYDAEQGVTVLNHMANPLQIAHMGLAIREQLEWAIWTPETAFPDTRSDVQPGEPLGQCLVTARFAKNYFRGAKVAEVNVRQPDGAVVGPHVVLEVIGTVSDQQHLYYLDITPDQQLAIGEVPQFAREAWQWNKVKLVETNNPDCPYILYRYQTDEEMSTKRSKPLERSRLLFELATFRAGHKSIQGIERYATEVRINKFETDRVAQALNEKAEFRYDIDDIRDESLRKKIEAAIAAVPDQSTQSLQVGLIEDHDLTPDNSWLWETMGLRGFNEAYIYNNGLLQEAYFYSQEQIVIVNLVGQHTATSIATMGSLLSDDKKLRPLVAPTLLDTYIRNRGWKGPVFIPV